ncbi:MAG TPA: cytochrome C [Anaeromyxobacteraceae bacterium]|nr:cytochrome C [Anaeromyxobacteraceae bacterium]
MHAKPSELSGPTLLIGSDPSSTCLVCHAGATPGGYQVMTTNLAPQLPPVQHTPGGDFAWLLKSYGWLEGGKYESSPGERHGHSVAAADLGLFPDLERPTAPGGTYPSDRLGCVSCHDPHGRYRRNHDATVTASGAPIVGSGSYGGDQLREPAPGRAVGTYRLLGGVGYAPRSAGSVVPFSAPPPVALAPPVYNRSERSTDTRVAYGAGMSEWCANCHGAIHTPSAVNSSSALEHPSGPLARLAGGGAASIYNQYVRTGDLSGIQATSYTSMVPYEEGTTDRTTLALHASSDGSQTGGPSTGNEQAMCLSCHRAHATAWDHATRWNMPQSGTITFGGKWPGVDAGGEAALPANAQGRTQAETRAGMYDRDPSVYASYQRVLCNKCHAKD